MPPYSNTKILLKPSKISINTLTNTNTLINDNILSNAENKEGSEKWQIVWRNVFLLSLVHISSIFGLYLIFTRQIMWQTLLWLGAVIYMNAIGTNAGAHRLWSHRSYKANFPLRLLLIIWQTMNGHISAFEWARDHRVHHKFSDTDADPYNVNRGFFFAHMGWIMLRKHKKVIEKGKELDISDLKSDALVMFQHKYYPILAFFMVIIFPSLIPYYFWNEKPKMAYFAVSNLAYVLNLHSVGLINSVAHLWGSKPFDKNINPVENKFVAIVSFGEGWHNFHHTFPYDYKASEFFRYNPATAFINFFARIGFAYDLKTIGKDQILNRIKRTGDGSIKIKNENNETNVNHHHIEAGAWGWGDPEISKFDVQMTETLYPINRISKKIT